MSSLFDIAVSKDRLTATILLKKDAPADAVINAEQMKEELQNKKIIFGIKEDLLKSFADSMDSVEFPLVIAEGKTAGVGADGYLVHKAMTNEEKQEQDDRVYNFRNVIRINSVSNGQLIAEIVKPSLGEPGIDLFGMTIPAKSGKPVNIKVGKNVMLHEDKMYATLDGQLSITADSVNVFPVFEVDGDLDLNTGNIDFIGNVLIRGNAPSGYTVKAGGDIHIMGLVEGAHLVAGGSIHISGGIAGGMRGSVEAGIDIHCNYLNQAICSAGQDVFIDRTILHSKVTSGGRVIVRNGHIIGGEIRAARSVEAIDFGNYHYMQTIIQIGNNQKILEKEMQLTKELKANKDSLMKLYMLSQRLNQRMEMVGALSTEENQLLKKQERTVAMLNKCNVEMESELSFIKAELSKMAEESFVKAQGEIYPNTQIQFGKYTKKIQTVTPNVLVTLEHSKIVSVPIKRKNKNEFKSN